MKNIHAFAKIREEAQPCVASDATNGRRFSQSTTLLRQTALFYNDGIVFFLHGTLLHVGTFHPYRPEPA